MARQGIEDVVRAHLIEDLLFGDDSVTIDRDTDLFDLGLDSLGINRLVVLLERRFSVRVPDAEVVADNFRGIEAIVALVSRLR
jgi:acyl carrier protein